MIVFISTEHRSTTESSSTQAEISLCRTITSASSEGIQAAHSSHQTTRRPPQEHTGRTDPDSAPAFLL